MPRRTAAESDAARRADTGTARCAVVERRRRARAAPRRQIGARCAHGRPRARRRPTRAAARRPDTRRASPSQRASLHAAGAIGDRVGQERVARARRARRDRSGSCDGRVTSGSAAVAGLRAATSRTKPPQRRRPSHLAVLPRRLEPARVRERRRSGNAESASCQRVSEAQQLRTSDLGLKPARLQNRKYRCASGSTRRRLAAQHLAVGGDDVGLRRRRGCVGSASFSFMSRLPTRAAAAHGGQPLAQAVARRRRRASSDACETNASDGGAGRRGRRRRTSAA